MKWMIRCNQEVGAAYVRHTSIWHISNYRSASNCRQVSNCRHTPKSDTSENLGVSQNGSVDRTWLK
jgi:hypothetical protein